METPRTTCLSRAASSAPALFVVPLFPTRRVCCPPHARPSPAPRTHRPPSLFTLYGRMRNSGGFQLPPRVPQSPEALARALQLLGNATQRKLTEERRREAEALLGAYPPRKEIAQQWRGALLRDLRRERLARLKAEQNLRRGSPVSPEQAIYRMLERDMRLPPRDEQTDAAFLLLGRLVRDQQRPTEMEARRLRDLIGVVPTGKTSATRAIKVLKRMALERFRWERWPPFVPLDLEHVRQAFRILAQVRRQGTAGERANQELRSLLGGAFPRHRRVATAWRKRLAFVIRYRERKARVAAVMELRRQKLLRRAAAEAASTEPNASSAGAAEVSATAERERDASGEVATPPDASEPEAQ
ncbi:hypothetical protein CDCA_CDCA15G3954 [Cyanidium caldarium]|uniref:Uncharacterized protein n=1 Tax=Cyanidium caldarium TaxID=2771 RepID=A0AAV9J099_CYACA|nr:hypothetical protein CDCA_CDCA15G3954 [Cyanidium caldarium]